MVDYEYGALGLINANNNVYRIVLIGKKGCTFGSKDSTLIIKNVDGIKPTHAEIFVNKKMKQSFIRIQSPDAVALVNNTIVNVNEDVMLRHKDRITIGDPAHKCKHFDFLTHPEGNEPISNQATATNSTNTQPSTPVKSSEQTEKRIDTPHPAYKKQGHPEVPPPQSSQPSHAMKPPVSKRKQSSQDVKIDSSSQAEKKHKPNPPQEPVQAKVEEPTEEESEMDQTLEYDNLKEFNDFGTLSLVEELAEEFSLNEQLEQANKQVKELTSESQTLKEEKEAIQSHLNDLRPKYQALLEAEESAQRKLTDLQKSHQNEINMSKSKEFEMLKSIEDLRYKYTNAQSSTSEAQAKVERMVVEAQTYQERITQLEKELLASKANHSEQRLNALKKLHQEMKVHLEDANETPVSPPSDTSSDKTPTRPRAPPKIPIINGSTLSSFVTNLNGKAKQQNKKKRPSTSVNTNVSNQSTQEDIEQYSQTPPKPVAPKPSGGATPKQTTPKKVHFGDDLDETQLDEELDATEIYQEEEFTDEELIAMLEKEETDKAANRK
ncbi:hypothetical protein AKO1_001832 [Acrasis kona]|uniref:FHA domain-containing protein n=1 Tax=Acrasis kona TaxID=1008807 RepID=A0AAW2Z9S8_9EUKA